MTSPLFDADELRSIVSELSEATRDFRPAHSSCYQGLPSRDVMAGIVGDLRSILFPGYFGNSELAHNGVDYHIGCTLDRTTRTLRDQVRRGLCFDCHDGNRCTNCELRAEEVIRDFQRALPGVRRLLTTDVCAHYEGDPAAMNPYEAIFCYPGLLAIISHRIAHVLHRLEVPLLPRIISEHAHSLTGIDIHPGATIGESFFIDHGTGVVIGETSVIGARVKLYQGVTLGAKSFPKDKAGKPIKGIPRHPIVEDDVVIYAGATVLGRITVGAGAVIGGNVWVTRDVPPGGHVTQATARYEQFEAGAGI